MLWPHLLREAKPVGRVRAFILSTFDQMLEQASERSEVALQGLHRDS